MHECATWLFLTRDKESQQQALRDMGQLRQRASALKQEAIAEQNEDSANVLLSLEQLTDACTSELRMWIALKADEPNRAWDHLVDAQGATRHAVAAHEIAFRLNAEAYARKLDVIERLVFPPQVFLSPYFVTESTECSICGGEYGECDHVAGRPYMGEMCHGIVKNMGELREVSIVRDPANKQARIAQFTDKGVTRDRMTWKVVNENQ